MWDLISVMQLEEWMKERRRLLLIDLREKDDYEKGHIMCAVHVPYNDGKNWMIRGTRPDRVIVCICYRGASSIRAAKKLASMGYQAYAVYGGMEAWEQRRQSAAIRPEGR